MARRVHSFSAIASVAHLQDQHLQDQKEMNRLAAVEVIATAAELP